MTVRFADPGAYNEQVHDALEAAFSRVAGGGRYVLGPEVEAFEHEFAASTAAAHSVGVGNGNDAQVLGLRALGVGPGDEVLVPTNTYVATWLAVSAVGALPVGVEPDPATHLLDPGRLEAAVTPRTRAVLPVHLYGQPADMAAVCAWAAARAVAVLADAAQAHGARLAGRALGGLGDAVAWSFYPTKNLGALGDGGAVTTDDPGVAERIRRLRHYGSAGRDRVEVRGVNSRLDELQAALLRVKLGALERWNEARRDQAARYQATLVDAGLRLPVVSVGADPAWHLYVVRCPERAGVRARLAAAGVETLVHYPVPPFDQPAYADLPGPKDFPIARQLAGEVLSLPLGIHLSEPDQDRVTGLLLDAPG